MSLLNEQIKALRTEAQRRKNEAVGDILRKAAETIEELSAELAAVNMQKSSAHYTGGWIPVEDQLPPDDNYVLLSFANYSLPDIGRYERDEDGDGAFYPGDEDYTYLSVDLYVNAWMPLPEVYATK